MHGWIELSREGSQTLNASAMGGVFHCGVLSLTKGWGIGWDELITSCFRKRIGGEGGITRAAPSPFGPPPRRGDVLRGLRPLRRTPNTFNYFNVLQRRRVQIASNRTLLSGTGQLCQAATSQRISPTLGRVRHGGLTQTRQFPGFSASIRSAVVLLLG